MVKPAARQIRLGYRQYDSSGTHGGTGTNSSIRNLSHGIESSSEHDARGTAYN